MADRTARELDPGTVAGSLGLAVVTGLVLPLSYGLLAPLLAIVVMALLADRHRRGVAALAAHGLERSLSMQPAGRRVALALTLALPAVVIATVAARGVSSIVVAYPAAIWGLMAATFGGLVLTLLPVGHGRWVLAMAIACTVPIAGVAGQRWEDAGEHARGWAFSGALLGIHPFQTTAVVVDGFGPHDIPVNDYVEPDGSRGYGPDEVAEALENSIRRIGALHYTDGPARARMAFENVEVIAVSTEPLSERLDRPAVERTHSRLWAHSGTTGQRSSIEFVCPGQREDPRGRTRDTVINPNCPTKYVYEGSAGLSVTARWTGYTEARGQERFGLARQWLGGTRTDDADGARTVEQEIRWGAWLFVAGVVLAAVPRRERGSAQEGLSAIAGAVGVLVVAIAAWAVARHGAPPSIAWVEHPTSWTHFDIRAWTPALAIGAVAVTTLGPGRGGRTGAGAIRVGAVPLALGVLAAAGSLSAATWLVPTLLSAPDGVAFERFVGGLADALWSVSLGPEAWSVQELEAAVAAVVSVLVGGAALAVLSSWGTSIDPPRHAAGRHWVRAVSVLAIGGFAAFVTVSRKTDGGAALVPAAMAILLVHGSCMGLMAVGRRPRALAVLVHLSLTALALWLVFATIAALPPQWFVSVCAGLGIASCIGALIFVVPKAEPEGDAAPQTPKSGRQPPLEGA